MYLVLIGIIQIIWIYNLKMNKNQNFKSTGQRKSWCTIQTGVQHYHRRNATYWCCQLALET